MAKSNAAKNLVPTEIVLSVAKLTVDFKLNVRLRKDTTVYGIVVQKDGYDLPTMMAQIIERGKILEAIHVSVRKDGTNVVLRGNRRALAGQALLAMDTTSVELKKELNSTKVLAFYNLTEVEEREMVMDQNSKPFSRPEIIQYAWTQRREGKSFDSIAVDNFEMWGNFGRNTRTIQALAKIRAIDPDKLDERRKAIKTWLRGTVDEYVLPAYDLGPVVQKACLLSEMLLEGMSEEKPHWYTTNDPQTRMKLLGQARDKDGSKWTQQLGGENFNAQIEKFHAEDFPAPGTVVVNPTKKRPTVAELKVRMNTAKSSPARMAFSLAMGTEEKEFTNRDDSVSLLEAKETLFLQHAEALDVDATVNVRDLLTQIFLKDNILDFKTLLESYCPTLPVINADKPADAEAPKGDNAEADAEESDTEANAEAATPNADGSFPLA